MRTEANRALMACSVAVRGATNWFSTAYNPLTNLFYVMSIEDCSIYKQAKAGGFLPVNNPADPAKRFLRALLLRPAWLRVSLGPL